MSFSMMVHLFTCIMHKLLSSNTLIKYASLASCRAVIAVPSNHQLLPNLLDQVHEGQLPDNQLHALLVAPDFPQCQHSWPVPSLGLLFHFSLTGSPVPLPGWGFRPLLSWFRSWQTSVHSFGYLLSCHYKLIILNARLDGICIAALGYALYSHGSHFFSHVKLGSDL